MVAMVAKHTEKIERRAFSLLQRWVIDGEDGEESFVAAAEIGD